MGEKYCLKWNDFNANASTAFGLLREEEFLQDVTLVGEDNSQIAAHKLVLSASSEYFKGIFKRNKHSNPLLLLEGVTSREMANILDYIYNGEVSLFQEDLDRFLAVAQRFKLNGLLGEDPNEADEDSPVQTSTLRLPPNTKREHGHGQQDHKRLAPKETFVEARQLKLVGKNEESMKLKLTEDEKSNLEEKINQSLEKTEDGTWRCTLCDNFSNKYKKQQVQYHIEGIHLEGLSLPCNLCMKTFRSRQAYNIHKTRYH